MSQGQGKYNIQCILKRVWMNIISQKFSSSFVVTHSFKIVSLIMPGKPLGLVREGYYNLLWFVISLTVHPLRADIFWLWDWALSLALPDYSQMVEHLLMVRWRTWRTYSWSLHIIKDRLSDNLFPGLISATDIDSKIAKKKIAVMSDKPTMQTGEISTNMI